MIKNFNWGHGITIFFVFFVGTLVFVLIKSFGVDRTLVVDEYYAEDLAYQSRYDKVQKQMKADNLKISTQGQDVTLEFKNNQRLNGDIHFYRASDESQDLVIKITDHLMKIPKAQLSKGKWTVKVDWKGGDSQYYKEQVIYL